MVSTQVKLRGGWSAAQIASFLGAAKIPLRLGVHDTVGSPWVVSLWFLYHDGALWCVTNRKSKLHGYLQRTVRCGFEVAGDNPPYRGIRGKGAVALLPERGGDMLERLLGRYDIPPSSRLARMLLAKRDEEVAICITPSHMTSWDFSERMADAVR